LKSLQHGVIKVQIWNLFIVLNVNPSKLMTPNQATPTHNCMTDLLLLDGFSKIISYWGDIFLTFYKIEDRTS